MLPRQADRTVPTHEQESKEHAKELRLVQSWKDQHLTLLIPLEGEGAITTWIPVTIEQEDLLARGKEGERPTNVTVRHRIPGSAKTVRETLSLSEIIATQDRYFVEQVSHLLKEIIFTERYWLRPKDANNETTGSERFSVPEHAAPPGEEEIQAQAEHFIAEYRELFLQQNQQTNDIAVFHQNALPLLRTMNSWSQGFGTPGRTGIELRTSTFPHWRDKDFAEVCRRVELVLEAMQFSLLLQELILFGTDPKGLPPAVSPKTYGEVLQFLQGAVAKKLVPNEGTETGEVHEAHLALQARIALIDQWHARNAPLHIKLYPTDQAWMVGSWTEGGALKQHPKNPAEKGVAIAYPDLSDPSFAKEKRAWFRTEQLIALQDEYFTDQTLLTIAELHRTHPWLTEEARKDPTVSGRAHHVAPSTNSPSRTELEKILTETALAYRRYAYAERGLTYRTDPRAERPVEPEIIHHWNAWSVGQETETGPYADYRYLYQTDWSDADYAELCKRMQREIRKTNVSVALQNAQRFGLASISLPTTASPDAFATFLLELEALTSSE